MCWASVHRQPSISLRKHEGVNGPWIDLAGQVAAVTGAAAGIGRAAALALAERGATVVALDRDGVGAEATASAIIEVGGQAVGRLHDVTQQADWDTLGNFIQEQWGRLDILANCAGIARFDRVDDAIFDTYPEVFAVNVQGVLLGMATALRFMRAAGTGAIINISSTASLKGNPAMASYGASKAAVVHFTRSAALEANRAGLDIRINAVMPGFTETAMAQQVYDQFDDKLGGRDNTMKVFSSGRAAKPEEIADLIVYLASDRASFISGSAIAIDRAQSA
jgi:NAD(P)-dependent dehydrogenase (short-subunit alcohol dehydrogenase family)